MRRLAVAILLTCGVVWGQAPAPQAVKAKVGTLAVLTSKATGEVAWVWDRRYLPEVQVYHDTAKKTLVITSGHAATFLVTCVEHQATKGFVQVEYLVTFEGGPLPPPGPGPDPPPVDTLETRMVAAYKADVKAGKVAETEMRAVRDMCKVADQIIAKLSTTNHLYMTVDWGMNATAPKADQVRKVLDAHLEKVHPHSKDVPLDNELKKRFGVAFAELTRAVEACLAPQPPPGPTPGPSPIPEPGLRVLIVYESSALTAAQNLIISGAAVRGYVAAKSGKFRAYDQNTPLVNEEEWAKNAMKRDRKSLPWIIVSNHPKGGFEGPMPATIQETMDLLKKWGE